MWKLATHISLPSPESVSQESSARTRLGVLAVGELADSVLALAAWVFATLLPALSEAILAGQKESKLA